jgi:hypothetical protein
MRKSAWTLLAVIMITGSSCTQNRSLEKEKEAIMAVIHEEAAAIAANDTERLFALHVRDSLESRLELGVYGFHAYKGWEAISTLLGDFTSGSSPLGNAVNSKENVVLKVSGKSAWLTCDNIWKWNIDGEEGGYDNIQIVFLEKIKGEWKISFSAYYSKPAP